MTAQQPMISVVVPAHDEERSIVATVEQLGSVLGELPGFTFEVIVVDDGSRDATGQLVAEAAARLPWLVALSTSTRSGKGAALRAGFAAARGELIGFVDADLQIPLVALADAVNMAQADCSTIVVGSRTSRTDGPLRRLATRLYRVLTSTLLGVRVMDVGCPLKVFPAALVRERALVSDGWVIDAELLARATRRGMRVIELHVAVSSSAGDPTRVRFVDFVTSTFQLIALSRALRSERTARDL